MNRRHDYIVRRLIGWLGSIGFLLDQLLLVKITVVGDSNKNVGYTVPIAHLESPVLYLNPFNRRTYNHNPIASLSPCYVLCHTYVSSTSEQQLRKFC